MTRAGSRFENVPLVVVVISTAGKKNAPHRQYAATNDKPIIVTVGVSFGKLSQNIAGQKQTPMAAKTCENGPQRSSLQLRFRSGRGSSSASVGPISSITHP